MIILQFVCKSMFVESLAPGRVVTGTCSDAEFFLTTDIDTLGGAGALRDPSRVDVRNYIRVCVISLLLEVLQECSLQVPVKFGVNNTHHEG